VEKTFGQCKYSDLLYAVDPRLAQTKMVLRLFVAVKPALEVPSIPSAGPPGVCVGGSTTLQVQGGWEAGRICPHWTVRHDIETALSMQSTPNMKA